MYDSPIVPPPCEIRSNEVKKILFLGFALACASNAMAQTSTTMVFSSGTVTAGNCQITGPLTLQITGQSVQITGGTLGSACAPGGGPPGGGASTASLLLSSTTFTLGSGSVPTLTLSSSDNAVTCNVTGTDGFSTAMTAGRAVSVNTPTTAPATITYTASGCSTTTQTSGVTNTVTLITPTAVLAVSPAGTTGSCSSGQTASIFGLSLTRVCSTQVNWQYPVGNLSYSGDVTSVDRLLSGTWGAYKKTQGKAFSISLASGTYVSFALTPTDATHGLQWAANTTFGDGGTIWLSTTPGGPAINNGACLQSANGSNSVLIYPFAGYNCSVAVGTTYYVNIADVAAGGTMQCSSQGSSCGSSVISYTTY